MAPDVPDATADDRFRGNVFVRRDPHVRFCAGHPLRAPGARVAAASADLLSDTGAFVTAFSARLAPATGRLDHVDAGHGLAFVLTAGGHRRLERSGPPLGVFPDDSWDTHRTVLQPGETLVVVSDGLLDFFPSLEETLDQVLRADPAGMAAQELVDRAIGFARRPGHPGDATVVVLRRLRQEGPAA